jgi:hypothetical protein
MGSHRMSREYGARVIRINPFDFQVPSSMDVSICCGGLAGLKGIDSLIECRNIC